jgi:hypothetical protein
MFHSVGKDEDYDLPERKRRSLYMYAPLREEMAAYKKMTSMPSDEDVAHVRGRKHAKRASIR